MTPGRVPRAATRSTRTRSSAFLRFYAEACLARGVTPLIENVPPVLRMRTGGVFLSPVGGHWRDLLALARARPRARLHARHLARGAVPLVRAPPTRSLFGLASDDELDLERYVEELGPRGRGRARLRRARPARRGPPVRRRRARPRPGRARGSASSSRTSSPRSTSPTPRARRHEGRLPRDRARARAAGASRRTAPRAAAPGRTTSTGRRCSAAATRCPRCSSCRSASAAGACCSPAAAARSAARCRPSCSASGPSASRSSTRNEALADRRPARARRGRALEHVDHVLCDIRDAGRLERELARARPDVVFHLAAYKHVDWAEVYPEEFVDNEPARQLERCCARPRRPASRRSSSPRPTRPRCAASFYGRTKRFMEQLDRLLGARAGGAAHRPCGSSTCSAAPAAPPSSSCARRARACR